eukprot:1605038-Prymnesium_polylepis.1
MQKCVLIDEFASEGIFGQAAAVSRRRSQDLRPDRASAGTRSSCKECGCASFCEHGITTAKSAAVSACASTAGSATDTKSAAAPAFASTAGSVTTAKSAAVPACASTAGGAT